MQAKSASLDGSGTAGAHSLLKESLLASSKKPRPAVMRIEVMNNEDDDTSNSNCVVRLHLWRAGECTLLLPGRLGAAPCLRLSEP